VSVAWKQFGTHVEIVPTLKRNGRIHVAVAVEISELGEPLDAADKIDEDLSVPVVHSRSLRAETELQSGETIIFNVSALPQDNRGTEPARELVCIATVERLEQH
jgi:Flp pilus assembly secretin CpaC